MGILVALLIGGIAGFLAGLIMEGRGFGIIGNIIVGCIGSLIFSLLFGSFAWPSEGFISYVLGGTIGAVILLFVIGLIKKV